MAGRLVDATLELHKNVSNTFLPSAVTFHYQFNLRELSNITQVRCPPAAHACWFSASLPEVSEQRHLSSAGAGLWSVHNEPAAGAWPSRVRLAALRKPSASTGLLVALSCADHRERQSSDIVLAHPCWQMEAGQRGVNIRSLSMIFQLLSWGLVHRGCAGV